MAITKRGGSWQASVLAPDGKRLRYSFKDEKEARIWVKEAELDLAKGLSPRPPVRGGLRPVGVPGRTMGDLLVTAQQAKWASHRTDAMFMAGRHAVLGLGEDLEVSALSYQSIVEWVWRLRSDGLSQSTINRRLSALSSMLRIAEELGWIRERPKLPFGKERKRERRFLSDEEEAAILSNLEGTREWGLCVLAVETGLRMSELINLSWRNVGFDSVTVVESKNEGSRKVPLTARARRVLDELPRTGSGPFAGMSRTEASKRFRRAAVIAGVSDDGVVFHSLRHTCASRLVMAGVQLRHVQAWMGHNCIQSTLVYAHLSPASLQDARAQLEQRTRMNIRCATATTHVAE